MSEADFIKVTCNCGKSFRASPTAVGKRARCPSCSSVLLIDAGPASLASKAAAAASAPARRGPAVATAARPQPALAPADPFDALDELARQEQAATPLDDAPRCTQCGSPWPAGAVLCTHCGFDTRTGKKLAVATAPKPSALSYAGSNPKAKATVDRMAPQGSFAAGLLVSLLFAVGASVVWIALAYATGFSIGYVAILIGGAAGVGMQVGHKGYSRIGGIAAAALTLVAILLAKWVVLEMLLSRSHLHKSISDLAPAKVGYYFFNPIGLIIIAVGMAAAFRTANGSITD